MEEKKKKKRKRENEMNLFTKTNNYIRITALDIANGEINATFDADSE